MNLGITLNFSHLNKHEFGYNFNDTLHPMCTCGLKLETILHYVFGSNLYSTQKLELFSNVCFLNPFLKNYSNEKLLNILLYGSEDFNCNMNKEILKAKIKFLKISERFNFPLF